MSRLKTAMGLALGLAMTAACASEKIEADDSVETVRFQTELGDIVLNIDTASAPVSAAHFLKHVDGGHYDGATFYRVVRPDNEYNPAAPIEVAQGGLMGAEYGRIPDSELPNLPVPLDPIVHETTDQTGLLNLAGTIAWARNEPGTANSEFFINLKDNPALDTGSTVRNPDGAGYAVFGRVTEGMDVLRVIQTGVTEEQKLVPDLSDQVLDAPVVIQRAERIE